MAAQAKGAAGDRQEVAAPDSRSPEFVGRDEALSAVVSALSDGPALVIVEGEPGIGKTRLLREALALAGDRTVLVAACPPLREPFPLGAIVDGVRRLRPTVGELGLSPLGGALRPLFPEWTEGLPAALEGLDDPQETRHRLLGALTELVERLGVGILVVEDAHWSDAASLEWLLTLTAAEPAPWSVVVTYRPSDVAEGSLLPRLTSRVPAGMGHLRVELEPLDVTQAGRLVASMLGTDAVSEQFAEFLHDRTDGVPLALEESVRLLRDRHDIIRHHGSWTRRVLEELDVPPTLRDSVLERVDRLRPEARQVLEAAAVLADPADFATLTAVAELDGNAGRQGLAAALVSGLLQEIEPGRYVFRHALDAQAVDGSIPASERRTLHRRAGETLEKLDPPPVARLARHFREANDAEKWSRHAETTADLALESGDDHAGVTILLEVLNGVELPLAQRVQLTRKASKAAFFGDVASAQLAERVMAALRRVLGVVELPFGDRGELRLLLGRMLWTIGQDVAALEEIEKAVPDLEHRPDLAIRAMADLALPVHPAWSADQHLTWLKRASELVDHVPSSDRLAFMGLRVMTLLLLGEDPGARVIDELLEAASRAQDKRIQTVELRNLIWGMMAWGRYDDSRRYVATALEGVASRSDHRQARSIRFAEAYLNWYTGTWKRLDNSLAELKSAGQASPSHGEIGQLMGLLDVVSGNRTAGKRRLQEACNERVRRGASAEFPGLLASAVLGRLHLSDGDVAQALEVTEPVINMVARKESWLCAADVAAVHVEALIASGRANQAQHLVDEFANWHSGRDIPVTTAAVALCQAILADAKGDLGDAAELFGEAAEAWAALPRPYDELLALERQGRCLLAAGEQDTALAMLSDTEQRLQALGARWDADRVAQVLRQHGVEVTRVWRRGRRGYGDQLSPRELEVVELVAQGMTNKQIAEVLFLSFRTVELHLRNAMRKLDVSSRTALAMAATEAGLISSKGEMPE